MNGWDNAVSMSRVYLVRGKAPAKHNAIGGWLYQFEPDLRDQTIRQLGFQTRGSNYKRAKKLIKKYGLEEQYNYPTIKWDCNSEAE